MYEEGISRQSPGLSGRRTSVLSLLVGLMVPLLQSGWTQLPGPLDADPQALLSLRSLAALRRSFSQQKRDKVSQSCSSTTQHRSGTKKSPFAEELDNQSIIYSSIPID